MCLLICSTIFPPKDLLEAGAEQNSDGIGIGYLSEGGVAYYKGLKIEELLKFSDIIKEGVPALIHFRKATVGGSVPELCHPFPINFPYTRKNNEEINSTKGITKLIFAHNGSILDWRTYVTNAFSKDVPVPSGKHWSDTKAIAFCLGVYGPNYLDILNDNRQKFATLNDKGKITRWGEWYEYSKGIHTSYNITTKKYQVHPHTQTGGGTHVSDDDKVIAIPVENPNARQLVLITRGTSTTSDSGV